MGADQAAVADGKEMGMATHLEGVFRQDAAALGIHRQPGVCQPGRRLTPRAGDIRSLVRRNVPAHGNGGSSQQILGAAIGSRGAQMKSGAAQQELGMGPAGAQRQRQLHRRGPTSTNPKRAKGLASKPREQGIQGFHSHFPGGRAGDSADIQTEAIKCQWRPPPQSQKARVGIHALDLRLDESDISQDAKAAKIKATAGGILQSGQDGGNKTGITEGAVAVDEGDSGGGRAKRGAHQPLTQQESMRVASSGEKQVVAPGTGIQADGSGGDHVIQ
jgi:hypothetical protein